MGGPKGVIRPGFNLSVRVSPELVTKPPPQEDEPTKRKKQVETGGGDAEMDFGTKKKTKDDEQGADADENETGGAATASGSLKGAAAAVVSGHDDDASQPVPAKPPSANAPENPKKGKKDKRERQKHLLQHLSLKSQATTPVSSSAHPFTVDQADHCETPFSAYQDIEPFLFRIALALKKPKQKLKIYDPYFCEGSVVKHLNRLGFTDVYNKNEDFYKVVENGTAPDFDVLVTNPPYSGDHFRKILRFCGAQKKPWLLLLPNFVCRKNYYLPSLGLEPGTKSVGGELKGLPTGNSTGTSTPEKPLFLLPNPTKPYRYWAPGRAGFEGTALVLSQIPPPCVPILVPEGTAIPLIVYSLTLRKTDTLFYPSDRNVAKGTTPFETFWYVSMGGVCCHVEIREWWLKKFAPHSQCTLPAIDEALPQQQRLQKRPNPRARKILWAKEKAAGGDGEKNKDLKNAAPAGIYYDPAKAQKLAEARRTRGEGVEPGVVPPGKRKRDKFKNKEKKKKPPRSE